MTAADERARRIFAETFGTAPSVVASAPGRINLIGEHTDYNEGWVLPAAIERRAFVAASPRPSSLVSVRAADLDEHVTFRLTELATGLDASGSPLPGWACYPAGVAHSLEAAGLPLVGLDAVLASDVPIGAGLSSSAAVEVAFALAWQALSGFTADSMTLARWCQRGENEYVGVQCGLMDPFIALHARPGHAILFDTRTLAWEAVPLPPDVALVVADSGVRHALGSSAYNERRRECAEAARRLAELLPGVTALRDVTPEQLDGVGTKLPPILHRRARHVVDECRRVHLAVERMRAGDRSGLGIILREGHASLRDLFEVSQPDVDLLVDLADHAAGCFGSRLIGGGFGGSTISLVSPTGAESFATELAQSYHSATGRTAQVWVNQAGGPAEVTFPSSS
jgi:galactokinase